MGQYSSTNPFNNKHDMMMAMFQMGLYIVHVNDNCRKHLCIQKIRKECVFVYSMIIMLDCICFPVRES